jgi:hypothetical protein
MRAATFYAASEKPERKNQIRQKKIGVKSYLGYSAIRFYIAEYLR